MKTDILKVETYMESVATKEKFVAPDAQRLVTGIRKEMIQSVIHSAILKIIATHYKNPIVIVKIMRALVQQRRKVLGDFRITKAACVDGRYYWDLYAPGYGSKAFEHYILGEINRIVSLPKRANRFNNVFVALTKKCALQCEHCFEWDALNNKERLSLQDLKKIVSKFQNLGTAQIQLTGGEPMLRINDVAEILNSSKPQTDFWILTSGMNLTLDNAERLKKAGLTGVVVSLDHFDATQHNQFRGHEKSFVWAKAAVKNCIKANLVTCLSLCVTRSFATESNLMAYAELAKAWGVSFVQLLEPKAVGHYKGMNVALEKSQEALLKDFYFKMNCQKKYSTYPIVTYHGYHQRQTGCFSWGNRNLYVDTDGDMHACPFCQSKSGNVLSDDFNDSLDKLQSRGCHVFESYRDQNLVMHGR